MKHTEFFLAAILSVPAIADESVVLTPTKDTDVYAFLNRPTGSIFDLGVSNTPEGQGGIHSQKSLIQFDLSPVRIPAGEIGKATLRLFVLAPDSPEGGGFRPGNVVLFRQGVAWGTVTSTQPSWSLVQPVGDPVAVVPVTASDMWIEIDVTPVVRAWVAGVENHGFVLQCEKDPAPVTANLLFSSMELGQAGRDAGYPEEQQYFPKLVITRAAGFAPVLTAELNGEHIRLSWSTERSGWFLEQADSPSGPWRRSDHPSSEIGGVICVEVPVAGRPKGFFRLNDAASP